MNPNNKGMMPAGAQAQLGSNMLSDPMKNQQDNMSGFSKSVNAN